MRLNPLGYCTGAGTDLGPASGVVELELEAADTDNAAIDSVKAAAGSSATAAEPLDVRGTSGDACTAAAASTGAVLNG